MQYSKLAFALALASSVSAQTYSISDLPTCAITPTLNAIGSSGCATTDIACVCGKSSFLSSLQPVVQAACSPADYQKTLQVAASLCLQAGVTISIPTATSGATTSVPASSAPASPSASVSSSAANSAAASTTSVAASVTTTAATVPPTSSNSTVTTSAKPSNVTTNAAAIKGTWAAAGLLGVAAMVVAL